MRTLVAGSIQTSLFRRTSEGRGGCVYLPLPSATLIGSAVRAPTTYSDAGVNIDEADRAVSLIKRHAARTLTPDVLTSIGSFGAGFALKGWRKPVLISSADGVGTKLKIAFATGRHDTVGEDLVNHCVNDIAVQGAKPLFFLDYFAVGKLQAQVCADVVAGIARGCKNNGCALIGGETAEMPGMYAEGEYDLAGFIVGAVERKQLLTGTSIKPGDLLLGLPSNGLHTNGYSLARKILFEKSAHRMDARVDSLPGTLADELLKVHRSYLKPIMTLHDRKLLKGAAHITGGGLTDNVPRVLPKDCAVEIDPSSWPKQPIFELLGELGAVPEDDFRRTFNLGVGLVLVISAKKLTEVSRILKKLREPFYQIGQVIPRGKSQRSPRVVYL
ncbi:MAG: phosphoribosylformylglycinamidine cyclo-ligase [Acidobacteriaceae bacterium]|nr:phosphoribosylformylglycinamidine cyclo-ligase [Acidobacteriaceae bacterium]MBV9222847.1 phosphoribosylformylglycinamidine cyclo-ligase [Acidobacteriaceae bacterium]MBV9938424.1 phosphoribosylformylglycinamidine cyclo-ligase [Acidobacteriaceae bacterium]